MLRTLDPFKSILNKVDLYKRYHSHKFGGFQPKVELCFEREPYVIKTVENGKEFEAVLKLRYEVFHREFRNKKLPFGIDVDGYDFDCDHLVIIDKRQNKLIGTYRFLCSRFVDDFYSGSEFTIDQFLKEPGVKLELGRACIHKDFRTGVIMNPLWKGLVAYIQKVQAQYLFGCASVKTTNPFEVAMVYKYLRDSGFMSDDYGIHPTQKYQMNGFGKVVSQLDNPNFMFNSVTGKRMIPALLASYLKAGAKIYGEPALDKEFKCIDFLTILQTDQVSKSFGRRYPMATTGAAAHGAHEPAVLNP